MVKKMKYIIDRFEGKIAVCEDETGTTLDINRRTASTNADVGNVAIFEKNHYRIDKKETEQRRKEIDDLMEELFED